MEEATEDKTQSNDKENRESDVQSPLRPKGKKILPGMVTVRNWKDI